MKLTVDPESHIVLDRNIHPVYGLAHYPRIKQLREKDFILFFQANILGGNIYYTKSHDLKSWDEPQILFQSYSYASDEFGQDKRMFATCDAAVLKNGDIIAVCSFRADQGYRTQPNNNGLVIKRSSDLGKTWSKPEVIYTGTNWEPHILQISTGELHVYFTHTAPKIVMHGFCSFRRSSGTALLRSFDNGHTWVPFVTEPPYEAYRVAQMYVKTIDGVQHFTDQMPVAAELSDGSIALALESYDKYEKYHISLAYTHNNWDKPLEINEEGPTDRINYLYEGAGPYIACLASGETVLSYNLCGHFHLRLGDVTGHYFGDPLIVFPEIYGFWGSINVTDNNSLVVAFPRITKDNNNAIALAIVNLTV